MGRRVRRGGSSGSSVPHSLLLGTGLGLSSVSPWASEGIDAGTFGVSSILWITFMQLAASAMGGYLAGRLRTKWMGVHTDEVYFRDTAHGLLAWAVATLGTAALLTSVIGSIIGGGVQAGASVVGGATSAAVGRPRLQDRKPSPARQKGRWPTSSTRCFERTPERGEMTRRRSKRLRLRRSRRAFSPTPSSQARCPTTTSSTSGKSSRRART